MAADVIVDDGIRSGAWLSSSLGGYQGDSFYTSGASDTDTFQFTAMPAGVYDILVDTPGQANSTNSAEYSVKVNGQVVQTFGAFDQRPGTGGNWVSLGHVDIATAGTFEITVRNTGSGYLRADAMRATEIGPAPSGPTIDDGATGYSETSGTWQASTLGGVDGDSRTSSTAGASAKFSFTGLTSGWREVFVNTPYDTASTTAAVYTVSSGSTVLGKVSVDQRLGTNGWMSLGTYYVSGTTLDLSVTNGATGNLRTDAVRVAAAAAPTQTTEKVDNGDVFYSEVQGSWFADSTLGGVDGDSRYSNNANASATFSFTNLKTGLQEVRVNTPGYSNSTPGATYTISSAGQVLGTVTIDQRPGTNGWLSLGSYNITGTSLQVTVTNGAGTGYLRADAVEVDWRAGMPSPTTSVDDGDAFYTETGSGWAVGSLTGGYGGDYRYHAPGSGADTANWTFVNLASGQYEVQVTWVNNPNRAVNSPFTVFNGTTSLGTVAVNQVLPPAGFTFGSVTWRSLGTYTITNGILRVQLGDNASGYVVADGVRLIPHINPPTTTGIPNVTANEDAANTVIPLTSYFLDVEDSPSQLTYTVQANSNPSLFASTAINGAGQLTLAYAANRSGQANLTIRATDTSGQYVETAFQVNVAAVADAPSLSVSPASGTEDTAISLAISAALVDTDGSESLSLRISNVPSGATLSAGTNNGDGSWTLTPAQLSGLTITPPANRDTGFALTVQATATESAGGSATTSASLAVSISGVNDPPSISVPSAQSTPQDTDLIIHGVSVSDVDAGSGQIQFSLSSVHGLLTLLTTQGLTFSQGDGVDDRTLVFQGTLAATNAALATIRYRPDSNYLGSDAVSLQVDDLGNTGSGGHLTDSKSIAVSVFDSIAPTLSVSSPLAGSIVSPNVRLVGSAEDFGTNIASISYTLDGGASTAIILGSDGSFDQRVASALLISGPHEIVVTAVDGAGNPTVRTIDFSVDDSFLIGPTDSNGWGYRTDTSVLLAERDSGLVQTSVLVGLGQPEGTRTIRFDVTPSFDTSDATTDVGDQLLVYLVDPNDSSAQLLSGDLPGTPIFSLSASGAEFPAGLVHYNGHTVEIDATSLGYLSEGRLVFQLVGGDSDSGTQVQIANISSTIDLDGTVGPQFSSNRNFVDAGSSLDLSTLTADTDIDVLIHDVSLDPNTGRYTATLQLHNRGADIGRTAAVIFHGLPSGVTLENASGTDTGGNPYLNLRTLIHSGGLKAGQSSDITQIAFDNPDLLRFGIRTEVLVGAANQAPTIAAVDPIAVLPGGTMLVSLDVDDADGDLVSLSLDSDGPLPNVTLRGDRTLVIQPDPTQIGNYVFRIKATDGALSTTRTVTLSVVSDPEQTTRISGRILSVAGEPIANIPVAISRLSVLTDADGYFTITLPSELLPTEDFRLTIPQGDQYFDPYNTGTQFISFRRARFDTQTGTDINNPRLHPNLVTSFIDTSMVYGSTQERADALRTFSGGKMKATIGPDGELIPQNNSTNFPDGPLEIDSTGLSDPTDLLVAGDVRSSENVALATIHSLLLREHNRLADQFAAEHPDWSDEQLYQESRRMVNAIFQHITYDEYLPLLLGPDAIPGYAGYDPNLNPGVGTLFTTAAFRLGHTQMVSELERLDADGNPTDGGPLSLRDAFSNVDPLLNNGIESLLRGLIDQQAQEIDVHVVDELRNFLFGPPGSGGQDLPAMNIQRGRDMGLPTYNQARVEFGLSAATTWSDISSNVDVQNALSSVYANVDQVDAFAGLIAEDHVPGALVGELLQKVLAAQFIRSRDADRFWYENGQFTEDELSTIRSTTLADLIEQNTSITGLSSHVLSTFTPNAPPPDGGTAASGPVSEYRSADGSGNNQTNTEWGSTHQDLRIDGSLNYADGISEPSGADSPSARDISNAVFAQTGSIPNTGGATALAIFWGQIISHDLALTPTGTQDTLRILGDEAQIPGESYPFVAEKLKLELGHPVYEGVNNVIERPIYLPQIDTANGHAIDPNQDTLVTTTNIPGASVFVAAGTLMDREGHFFTDDLSITRVPTELTPAVLPPDLRPGTVVTIQPAEMVFSTPAPLSLPNDSGLAAGSLLDLWSINPITGTFDKVGVGQVSEDGLVINTIEGGIHNSSWHFFAPPPVVADDTPEQGCGCPPAAVDVGEAVPMTPPTPPGSQSPDNYWIDNVLVPPPPESTRVETNSGAFRDDLPAWAWRTPWGEEWQMLVSYDSTRADPTAMFRSTVGNANFQNTGGARISMSARIEKDGQSFDVSGFVPGTDGNTHGLQGGEQLFSIPTGVQSLTTSIQADLNGFETGVYDYSTTTGLLAYNADTDRYVGSTKTNRGQTVVVNSVNSAFGAGWGLSGWEQIYENSNGYALLVDGDGSEILFAPPTTPGGAYTSPDMDFSVLTKDANGHFTRVMPDQTTYTFNGENKLESVRDRRGQEMDYQYNEAGQLVKVINPSGLESVLTYNADGRVETMSAPGGRLTHFYYDDQGNLTQVQDPENNSATYEYNADHLMTASINKNDQRLEVNYASTGRVSSVLRRDGTQISFQPQETMGYQSPERTTDPFNAPPATPSSASLARTVDGNGSVTQYNLDRMGHVNSITDAFGNTSDVEYNAKGLISKSTDGRGNVTLYSYDSNGNLIRKSDSISQSSDSPVLFSDPVIKTTLPSQAADVALVHLDQGAILDRVAFDGASIWVSLNNGSFAQTYLDQVAVSFTMADLNQDGRLDLITANSDGSVGVRMGRGDGTFRAQANYGLSEATHLAVGDLNGDGKPDVVATTDGTISVFLGLGDGTLATPVDYTTEGAGPVELADVTGDGTLDVIAGTFVGSPTVSVFSGNGDGTLGTPNDISVSGNLLDLKAVDANSDGTSDVAILTDDGQVRIYLGAAGGSLVAGASYAAGGTPARLLAGDVNGDGIQDLVVAGGQAISDGDETVTAGRIVVLIGSGSGTYQLQAGVNLQDAISGIALGDVNEDDQLDLLAASGLDVQTVLNEGGKFVDSHGIQLTAKVQIEKSGDLNGDGYDDIVVITSDHKVTGYLNDGSGHFSQVSQFSLPAGIFVSSAVLEDINQDGKADLAIAESAGSTDTVSVFLNQGSGAFGASTDYALPAGSFLPLEFQDVDGDGDLDLVQAGGVTSVRLNDGNGSFGSLITTAISGSLSSVAFADFDGDSTVDMAVSSNGTQIRIWTGNGDGTFTAGAVTGGLSAVFNLTTGDMNNDGISDLVFAGINSISVMLGTGTGTFATPTDTFLDRTPSAITLGDFDGDGILDLLAVESSLVKSSVIVLSGVGGGVFDRSGEYFATPGAFWVTTGHFDNNSGLDFSTGGETLESSGVSVNLNTAAARNRQARDPVYTYDPVFNQITSMTDELGRVTLYERDPANGNLLSMTQVVGRLDATSSETDDIVTHYTYTDRGLVDTVTDPLGHVTDYDYDTHGWVTSITAGLSTPEQSTIHYEYDAIGDRTAVVDPLGRRTQYAYDLRSRLTDVTQADPDGGGPLTPPVTHYDYDGNGNVSKITDPLGHQTAYTYDTQNRLLSTTDAQGHVTSQSYDAQGNVASVTDELGRVTRYTYDARNRRSTMVDPAGQITQYFYDADNNLIRVIDPLGNTTSLAYDARSRFVRSTDALGNVTEMSYDAANQLTRLSDPLGRSTQYLYDDLGRNIATTDALKQVSTKTYDDDGNVIRATDALGNSTTYGYDALNRLTTITQADPDGSGPLASPVTTMTYDAASQLLSVVDPLGRTTSYAYDNLGRKTSVTGQDPDGVGGQAAPVTTYAYDAVGNLTEMTDALGRVTDYTYDEVNRLTQVASPDPDGAGPLSRPVATMAYDPAGQLIATTDPLGRTTRYAYDALGRQVTVTEADPDGIGPQAAPVSSIDYDAVGNVLSTTDPTGAVTQYRYDNNYRLVGVTQADPDGAGPLTSAESTLEYDKVGQVVATTDSLGRRSTIGYDELGRQIRVTSPDPDGAGSQTAPVTQWTYDAVGNVLTTIDARGSVTSMAYDNLYRQTGITEADPDGAGPLTSPHSTMAYDAAGQLTEVTDAIGRTTDFAYDGLGRQISITSPDPDGAGPDARPVSQFAYDLMSNLIQVTDATGSATDYTYDGLDRLTKVTAPDPDAGGPLARPESTFTYDSAGQLLSKTDPLSQTTSYTYDALGRTIQITAPDPDAGGPKTSPTTQLAYNANGDLTQTTDALGRVTQLSYDARHRLTQVTSPDPDGAGGVTSSVTQYTYDSEDQLLSTVDPLGRTTSYAYDNLGRQVTITSPDPDGMGPKSAPVTQMVYDSVGNLTSVTDALGNVTGFAYDYLNRLTTMTEPDPDGAGSQTSPLSSTIYDAVGQILATTDPLGRTTSYAYDGLGRLSSVTEADPDDGGPKTAPVTTFMYDAVGDLLSTTDALGNTTQNAYDRMHRLVQTTEADPDGGGLLTSPVTTFAYDAASQLTSVTDPLNRTTSYGYDRLGRQISVTQPDPDGVGGDPAPATTFDYDAVGNLTSTVDALGNATAYAYDGLDRLVSQTQADPDGVGPLASPVTHFTYDKAGQLTSVSDPLNRVTSYTYDNLGRKVSETDADPDGAGLQTSPVTTWDYDAVGNLTATTDALGNTSAYAYDNLYRLTTLTQADPDGGGSLTSPVTHYSYDAAGQLTAVVDPLGRTTSHQYDKLGRQTQITEADPDGTAGSQTSPITKFDYDAVGNLLSTTDALNNVTTYAYDNLYRLSAVTEADPDGAGAATSPLTSYHYDAASQLTSVTDPLNRTTSYNYDNLGRRVSMTQPDPDGAGGDDAPVTRWSYDLVGNLRSTTDALNNVTTYAYDNLYRLSAVTEADPDGVGSATSPVTTYHYDVASQLTSATDPLNRTTSYAYDNLGRQTSVTQPDPDGAGSQTAPVTSFGYDALGNVLNTTDALGNVTAYAYDNLYRLTTLTQADPDGSGPQSHPVTHYNYDAAGQLTSVVDPLSRTTSYQYDDLGRQTQITSPDPDGVGGPQASPVTKFGYDAIGNLLSKTDSLNNVTTYAYDNLYRLSTVTEADPDGGGPQSSPVTSYQYDVASQLTSVTDPLNRTTSYAYDNLGRQTQVTLPDPDGAGALTSPVMSTKYDLVGNVIRSIDPRGNSTDYTYDHLYRLTQITEADPDAGGPLARPVSTFAYDAVGQLTSSTDPLSRTTTYDYDGLGRQTAVTSPDPDGAGPQLAPRMTYGYDAVGNLLSATDRLGHSTTYGFDNLYRQTSVTDPNGDATTSTYDLVGNLTSLTDPEHNTTSFVFDGLDRLTTETNQLGYSRTYAYDSVGNLTHSTDRDDRQIAYIYDHLNRQTDENWLASDGTSVVGAIHSTYDSAGQTLSEASSGQAGTSATAWSYDNLGRVTSEDNAGTPGPHVVMSYGYDASSNRTSEAATVNGTADYLNTYTYDGLDRLTRETQTGVSGGNPVADKRVDFGYDAAGELTSETKYEDLVGSALVAACGYTYDAAGRLTSLVHSQGASALASYSYAYDAANRLTQVVSSSEGTTNYAYDNRGQLTGTDHASQADEGYTYDANGNRTNAGSVIGPNNQLLSDGTFNYTYDPEGNRTKRTNIATGEVTDYTFDYRDRLTGATNKSSASGPATQTTAFAYDADNRHVSTTLDADGAASGTALSQYFGYTDGNIALAFNNAGSLANRNFYGFGDQVLADEQRSGTTLIGIVWPLGDNLGTGRDLAQRNSGTGITSVTDHRTFDTFGNITSETNSSAKYGFGFTGRPVDASTGLQNNLNRWYDSGTGQWISEDPVEFAAWDANLHRYAGNTPTQFIDPNGLAATRLEYLREQRESVQDKLNGYERDIARAKEEGKDTSAYDAGKAREKEYLDRLDKEIADAEAAAKAPGKVGKCPPGDLPGRNEVKPTVENVLQEESIAEGTGPNTRRRDATTSRSEMSPAQEREARTAIAAAQLARPTNTNGESADEKAPNSESSSDANEAGTIINHRISTERMVNWGYSEAFIAKLDKNGFKAHSQEELKELLGVTSISFHVDAISIDPKTKQQVRDPDTRGPVKIWLLKDKSTGKTWYVQPLLIPNVHNMKPGELPAFYGLRFFSRLETLNAEIEAYRSLKLWTQWATIVISNLPAPIPRLPISLGRSPLPAGRPPLVESPAARARRSLNEAAQAKADYDWIDRVVRLERDAGGKLQRTPFNSDPSTFGLDLRPGQGGTSLSRGATDKLLPTQGEKFKPNPIDDAPNYKLNRKLVDRRIQGTTDFQITNPELLSSAGREVQAAEDVLAFKGVEKVLYGTESQAFLRLKTGGLKTKNTDAIGFLESGKYILGEGKGGNVNEALEQFEVVGEILGSENIAAQHVVARKLPPGYQLDKGGFLMKANGGLVRVNGKPVSVRLVGE